MLVEHNSAEPAVDEKSDTRGNLQPPRTRGTFKLSDPYCRYFGANRGINAHRVADLDDDRKLACRTVHTLDVDTEDASPVNVPDSARSVDHRQARRIECRLAQSRHASDIDADGGSSWSDLLN